MSNGLCLKAALFYCVGGLSTSGWFRSPDLTEKGKTMLTERDIDIHVGQQVRKRRKALGLSQTALAKHLGLTFQQVQKMEKGVNRIGAGRLKQLTIVLDVPIETFYDGIMAHEYEQSGDGTRHGYNKYPGLPQPLQKQINALIAEIEKTLG